jgi:hypothetical protein
MRNFYSIEKHFYVYHHINENPEHGQPGCRYIGKGKRNRAFNFYKRNKHWHNIFTKDNPPTVVLIAENLTEEEAFAIEIQQIAFAREHGVKLCNITNGGEGVSIYVRKASLPKSKETIDKIKQSWGEGSKHRSEETRLKRITSHIGKVQSPETIAKRIAKNTGQKRTPEVCKILSALAKKRKPISEKTRERQRESYLGYKQSQETIEKRRQINTGKTRSEETKFYAAIRQRLRFNPNILQVMQLYLIALQLFEKSHLSS